jgi:glycosyltransferase involved in cell wall biosynthesis
LEQMRPYRNDLCLLPNPLDLNVYEFRLRSQPRPLLVWLRAFNEGYNPSLAPKAVALLIGDFPNIQLTMIGPDKGDGSLQRLQQVMTELNVADQVSLTGGVPKTEVPRWINGGDMFLNTTNMDNAPVSVMEAMACGLCVVSTNVGGIPYLLEHEHDALLVPPDDPEAMATAIRRVLTEPGLAERLSRNARHKAEQFDWANILPKWEHLLMSVAAGHTP